jgi:D-3-phosphoglycerate dehydrogenase / 2-oxoglutarate reductase
VAEHTFGMILDLSKRITEADRDVRLKSAFNFEDYRGHEVHGKTLGILGLGNVGSKVAAMAQAFSLQVLGFDLFPKNLPGVQQVDLDTLLKESDIIAIILPLTPQTQGLIGQSQVSLMKRGVILVNTAREEVMDKSAIISAVASGQIAGLGVDVKILTQVPPDDPYLQFPNILVTPHSAFCTFEADKNVKDMWVQNILAFASGHPQKLV